MAAASPASFDWSCSTRRWLLLPLLPGNSKNFSSRSSAAAVAQCTVAAHRERRQPGYSPRRCVPGQRIDLAAARLLGVHSWAVNKLCWAVASTLMSSSRNGCLATVWRPKPCIPLLRRQGSMICRQCSMPSKFEVIHCEATRPHAWRFSGSCTCCGRPVGWLMCTWL